MTNERRVLVHRDAQELTGSVAARFITKMIDILDEKPEAHVVLTGGRVGVGILGAINESHARDSIDWARVHVWWGDERWLPVGHEERNDTQADLALLDHVGIPAANVHRYGAPDDATESDDGALDAAAARYSDELAAHAADGSTLPTFEITFLGVGPDGHIASLFPDAPGVREQAATAIAVRNSPKPPPERLSLTLPAINSSERIWLAMAGPDKASALGLALAGASIIEVPAAGAKGVRRTVFFVDEEAAQEVPDNLISQEY
ncbi:6-phosphogluconolactonase [Marisediminicola senii]|uniref:6-phosphogluconolactonase n=1 Tax=Marisediminicola senii TaxID=2711233 RepID=UPI0013EC6B4E|nr:6-phosphogluconolactonase [Marisediminicola senii]